MSGGLSGLAPSRGASAAKSRGSLPPSAPLPCGAPPRPAGGGHARRSLASAGLKGREKSVLSRFRCGVSEKRSITTARASPSEREALWSLNSCPARVSGPTFVRRTPLRRHGLDPRRRKSSIIARPFEAGSSCSQWTTFSMTTSKPPWPSTVSQSVRVMAWRNMRTSFPSSPMSPAGQGTGRIVAARATVFRPGHSFCVKAGSLSMALPYGPPASDGVHKCPNNQSLVPIQDLDSADPDSIRLLLLPQPWRGGGGCEGTSWSGIGTRMRSRSPEEEGAGPGALPVAGRGQRGRSATRNKGEPAYPMSDIGAGEGLRPFEPRLRGSSPVVPHHPRRGVSGKLSTTTARAPPSERKALAWFKARATWTRHRVFWWRVGLSTPP